MDWVWHLMAYVYLGILSIVAIDYMVGFTGWLHYIAAPASALAIVLCAKAFEEK